MRYSWSVSLGVTEDCCRLSANASSALSGCQGSAFRIRQLSGLALMVVTSTAALAQVVLVNVTSCGPQNFPSATCTIPATGAGHLIVVGFQIGGGANTATTVSGITDNVGNSYAEAGAALSIDTAAGSVADIWYAKASIAGATKLTVTPSLAVTNGGVVVWEISGIDTTAPLDRTATLSNQPSSGTPSGASVTTTAASEVVISLATVAGNITGIASGNTFVGDSALKGNGWAHLVTSAVGSYAAKWNESPAGTFASSTASFKAATALNACDINADGVVNVVDIQLASNMNLGLTPCTANIAGPGVCSPLVIQQITTAALTGVCTVANSHTVTLNWTASTTPNVNYNVYRSGVSGGPYTKLTASPVNAVTYTDGTVFAGQTYYYVTTAINTGGESAYSNQATAAVPFP
jgi:hypothetical protein